jgi:adenosylcobinamide kinase/adenosylcobinamide-phosphate guanylyltransferase
MRKRIARHRADRAQRLPGVVTVEEPLALADAIRQHSAPGTLLVVDCLTLWLTNLRMPQGFESNTALAPVDTAQEAMKRVAIQPQIRTESVDLGFCQLPLCFSTS